MKITSSANTKIKWIRKLRERKARQETGCFYAEGLRIVVEAVQQGADLQMLLVAPELLTSALGLQLVEEQAARGVEVGRARRAGPRSSGARHCARTSST